MEQSAQLSEIPTPGVKPTNPVAALQALTASLTARAGNPKLAAVKVQIDVVDRELSRQHTTAQTCVAQRDNHYQFTARIQELNTRLNHLLDRYEAIADEETPAGGNGST